MRRILIASALATPMLLTAAAFASSPAEDAAATAQTRPVSTGVVEPQLLYSTKILVSPETAISMPTDARVVLKLNVDRNGMTQGIQVVKSTTPSLDAAVVDAVRQFRWQPATLDKQAIPVDLTLSVLVQH